LLIRHPPSGRVIFESHSAGEGGQAGPVSGAKIDAGTAKQHVDDSLLSVLDGMVKGSLPLGIGPVDVGSVLNERGDNFLLSPLGGQVQRTLSVRCLIPTYSMVGVA
jgi:hypothetical protein